MNNTWIYIVMSETYWCVYSISLENGYVTKIQVQQMFQKKKKLLEKVYIFLYPYTHKYMHIQQANLMEFAHLKKKTHSHIVENIILHSNKNVTY